MTWPSLKPDVSVCLCSCSFFGLRKLSKPPDEEEDENKEPKREEEEEEEVVVVLGVVKRKGMVVKYAPYTSSGVEEEVFSSCTGPPDPDPDMVKRG